MIPTGLYILAEHMQILRLHCTFVFHQGGELPSFKGSTLHGWLGQQLLKQDPQLYDLLYAEHGQQQPKPYALACHDYRTRFLEQSILSFELTLFGSATQLADRLLQALTQNTFGFGAQRLRISIQSVASNTPQGLRFGVHTLPLAVWLQPEAAQLQHEYVLQLTSPLRIKRQGKIIKDAAPTLPILLGQVQRRLALLSEFWVSDNPKLQQMLAESIPIGEHRTLHSPLYFEDWQRYSNTQQKHLPFGGLLGELCYQGDIYHALVWLQAGQVLQLGGKTTFGLGCYHLLY